MNTKDTAAYSVQSKQFSHYKTNFKINLFEIGWFLTKSDSIFAFFAIINGMRIQRAWKKPPFLGEALWYSLPLYVERNDDIY